MSTDCKLTGKKGVLLAHPFYLLFFGARSAAHVFSSAVSLILILALLTTDAFAVRIKEIAAIKGVRENILIGYGIVVGLRGTGDSSAEVTSQSLIRLFGKLGLETEKIAQIKSKNAAAVIVTAKLPPFARVGNKIDITVSSIGDSGSLEGGTLLVAPLRAGDQNVYAVAQGQVSIGSVADGTTKNFPTVGMVVNGATIEKDLDMNFSSKKSFRLSLHNPDFTTSARLVTVINGELGGKFASAMDSGTIDVVVPFSYDGNVVELLAMIENIQLNVDTRAKVVLNERTGTVVMGHHITISPVAISHGDLTIQVSDEEDVPRKPAAMDAPNTPKEQVKTASKKPSKPVNIAEIKKNTSVSDLVKVLNAMGVKPRDLTAIFQTLKRLGALQAEVESG
jgi:flagellar P-ring protein precursor FlgI